MIVASTRSGSPPGVMLARKRAVSALGEPERMVAWLFEVAGSGDMGGQVTTMTGRRDAVIETLEYQGGHVNRGQHGAHVDIADHPDYAQERARVDRHPLKSPEELSRVG
jgi:hypothetical protein